jgi:hypothetical protein
MNALNTDFNNRLALIQNPPALPTPANTWDPKALENLKNANVSQVNPPVAEDHFVRQDFESKQKKDVKKKEKKPFNPWKWMVLTPLITLVGLPFVGIGVAGAWFMHTPSSISKSMKPETLTKMLEAYSRKEAVKIPEGLKIPTYTGTTLKDGAFIRESMMGIVKALRHLPKDNKWEILKYVLSPKGIKEFIQVPLALYDGVTLNFESLKTRDLSFIANVLAKGGTMTKKYGQGLADAVKRDVMSSHARVLELEKTKAPIEEIKKAKAAFESSRRFYKAISQLQSQEVQLTKKQEKHFTHLYELAIDAYNKKNPSKPLQKQSLKSLKKIEASTAIVVLQDGVAIKLQRADARADNAVSNFELMTHFSAIEEAVKAIRTKQDASLASKDAAVKSATEKAGAILEGANFHNEVKGLEAIRALQEEAGVIEGLAPKPHLSEIVKGKDGHDYGIVVMDKIEGPGDLSKVILNAVMSKNPFDLSSKEWKLYHRFMQEDALATVGMQSLRIRTTDGHGGNFLLKTKPVSQGNNGGAVPIDVAEYLEVPKESMKQVASLFLACVKTGHLQDHNAKNISRSEAMQLLNQLLDAKGQAVPDSVKKDLLIQIEASPLRILGKLFKSHEIAESLQFPNARGLNANNVGRAESKFNSFIETLGAYERNLEASSPEGKAFKASKEKAAETLFAQMENYAGKTVNPSERSAHIDYVRRRFLSSYGSGNETSLSDLQEALKWAEARVASIKKEIDEF